RWQVCNCGNPFGGIGSIRPRTEHGCVLRDHMLGPELYDRCPSGAIPKPGKEAIVSLKMALSSPLSVRTRVCNNKCAPSLDHCICCFLQNRLLTTSFTVDSTNPVAIGSPLR